MVLDRMLHKLVLPILNMNMLYCIRKKFHGVFNFVDDKDSRNFFHGKAIIHEIYYTVYLQAESTVRTNNIVHTCALREVLYIRKYTSYS